MTWDRKSLCEGNMVGAGDRCLILIPILTLVLGGCATAGMSSDDASDGSVAASTSPTSSDDTDSQVDEGTPEPDDTPAPADASPKLYKPGDTITITANDEDWATVTITKVATKAKYDGAYNLDDKPAKGNVYIQLYVTYKALQDGVSYNSFDWDVFANDVAVDDFTYVSNGPTPTLNSGELPKGRQAKGWLVYEVPKTGRIVLSYNGNMFLNEAPIFEVLLRAK
jgi:hypothetical protein